MALYRLAVNNAGRHTAARRNCFASYFPDDAGGKQTATREGKGGGGGGLCRVYKKETTEVLPFLCRVEYLSFNPVECDKSFCPFSLCLLSSSIFPFPPPTFFFHSIFLPSFDVSLLLLLSPLSLPLNLSCSISPSSSRLSRNVLSAQMNI